MEISSNIELYVENEKLNYVDPSIINYELWS